MHAEINAIPPGAKRRLGQGTTVTACYVFAMAHITTFEGTSARDGIQETSIFPTVGPLIAEKP